jgi:hypothetical protein
MEEPGFPVERWIENNIGRLFYTLKKRHRCNQRCLFLYLLQWLPGNAWSFTANDLDLIRPYQKKRSCMNGEIIRRLTTKALFTIILTMVAVGIANAQMA